MKKCSDDGFRLIYSAKPTRPAFYAVYQSNDIVVTGYGADEYAALADAASKARSGA